MINPRGEVETEGVIKKEAWTYLGFLCVGGKIPRLQEERGGEQSELLKNA